MPLSADVDLEAIAKLTSGCSGTHHSLFHVLMPTHPCILCTGAELSHLCREAALLALRADGFECRAVKHEHFMSAVQHLLPSPAASTAATASSSTSAASNAE
jgi:SpoVK/Ycf46/Vps4 family AAA+-type ATPase